VKRIIKNNINTKEYWDDLLDSGTWGKGRWKLYKKLIKYFPKKRKMTALDIGCAVGHGLIELANKLQNISFEGCDFSDKGIKQAKKLYGNKMNFFVHDVYKDDLIKKYDFILFIETLEHINNPKKIIRKYLKYCNEKIFVTVPYKQGLWKEHIYRFDEYSFKEFKEFKKYYIHKIKNNSKIILYIFEK